MYEPNIIQVARKVRRNMYHLHSPIVVGNDTSTRVSILGIEVYIEAKCYQSGLYMHLLP